MSCCDYGPVGVGRETCHDRQYEFTVCLSKFFALYSQLTN